MPTSGGAGALHHHLRCRKQRRKRYGTHSRRGLIPNRTSIDERPKVVEAKQRVGDWEADTIIGRGHRSAIVSLVERKSKLVRLCKVERKSAEQVAQASLELLSPLSDKVHTITSDNGGEFAQHERIAAGLGARFYFAHPYASWERRAQREHQRACQAVLPEEARLHDGHGGRGRAGHGAAEQPPAQDARLPHAERSLFQTTACCTSNLNPRFFDRACESS